MAYHLASAPPPLEAVETGCHLLLYVRCCLARVPYPGVAGLSGVAPPTDAELSGLVESTQMAMLAFVLWPQVSFFRAQDPTSVTSGMQVLPALPPFPRPVRRTTEPHVQKVWEDAFAPGSCSGARRTFGVQDPHPVLQLLLEVDTAAVIDMFDCLSLLEEGLYCGSDDLAAQVLLSCHTTLV